MDMNMNETNIKIEKLSSSTFYLLNTLIKNSNIQVNNEEFENILKHLKNIESLNKKNNTNWRSEPRPRQHNINRTSESAFNSYSHVNKKYILSEKDIKINHNLNEYIPEHTLIRHKINDNYQMGTYKNGVIISDNKHFNTPCLFTLYHYNKVNHIPQFNHNNAWNECEVYINREWIILNKLNIYD